MTRKTTAQTTETTQATAPENKVLTPFTVSFLTRNGFDLTAKEVKICLKQIKPSGVEYFSRGLRFYNLNTLKLDVSTELVELEQALADLPVSDNEETLAQKEMLTAEISLTNKLIELIQNQLDKLAVTETEKNTWNADKFLNLCAIYVNKPFRLDGKEVADVLSVYKKVENLEGFLPEYKQEAAEKINAIADHFSTVENDYYYNCRLRLGNGGATSLSGKCAEWLYMNYGGGLKKSSSELNYNFAFRVKYGKKGKVSGAEKFMMNILGFIILAMNKHANTCIESDAVTVKAVSV